MTAIDLEHLKQWEGKQESHDDVISLATAQPWIGRTCHRPAMCSPGPDTGCTF